jgi:hypothetical protein
MLFMSTVLSWGAEAAAVAFISFHDDTPRGI